MNLKDRQEKYVNFYQRITDNDKALFYEHIANLIEGGISLVQSMKSFLNKTTNPRLFNEVLQLIRFIESGDSVSMGMKKMPDLFAHREIAVIEAGEQSGTLYRSFVSLGQDLREELDLRSRVIGSLAYPFIIIIFLMGAVLVIMTYVIPKLEPMFTNSNVSLPFVTQLLINTSHGVESNFFLIIFVLIAGIFLYRAYARSYGKRTVDRLKLNLPLLGDVWRNFLLARYASTLALLIGSNIPIIRALRLTGQSTNNSVIEDLNERLIKRVEEGKKIAESMEELDPHHEVFAADFVQLIGAGEQTSTINKIATKIAAQYRRSVEHSLSILVRFIEPAAILLAGIFVLWFAFAIFSAVLSLNETVAM